MLLVAGATLGAGSLGVQLGLAWHGLAWHGMASGKDVVGLKEQCPVAGAAGHYEIKAKEAY